MHLDTLYTPIFLLVAVLLHTSSIFGAKPCAPRSYDHGSYVCVCNSTYCDTVDPKPSVPSGHYLMYVSTKEGLRFNRTSGVYETKITSNNVQCEGATFNINTTNTFQKIKGFGGAFTDSAGINILSLSKPAQEKLLRSYFSNKGIEYNIARVPIGGTDDSTHPYTYDDDVVDPTLEHFNLTTEDYTLKIPIIIRAKKMSKRNILFFASAWSAPIFMKTNNKITGFGFLKREYYGTWADYHIKFLDAYKKFNISFWALTTGNEPLNGIIPWLFTFNSMGWTPWTHREWIGQYLGPKLQESQHKIVIIGFDDQRILLPWWMKLVLQDPEANNYIKGIGVHWYTDILSPVSNLEKTHDAFPDKFLMYTEACAGFKPWSRGVLLGSWERGEEYMHSIISTINRWVTAWTDWNLALNLEGGPNWDVNYFDSPIVVNASADEFYKEPIYYAMGHASKFIKRGALRVDIQPQQTWNIEAMAVQNPDKEVVIVFYNKDDNPDEVSFKDLNNNGCIKIEMPGKSFATIIYKP